MLKDLREADFLPTYQSLPPPVQEKICLIEFLYHRAMLYLRGRERARAGVPDFDSHLRDLSKNMARVAQEDHEDEPKVDTGCAYYLGLDLDGWIETLGDSRYVPPPDLVHLAMMLPALWIYWITWPNRRRIFEEEKKINLSNVLEPVAPPSAPSFEATLDRSLVWLALLVGIETANIRHWGKKRETAARLNLERKSSAAEKGKAIFSAFAMVRKEPGDTFNRIVDRILKFLNKEGENKISKTSIEKAIRGNLQLMNDCFREEIRGKVKRIIYIRNTHV